MSRKNKTSKNSRTTYIYYDSAGNKQIELRPGENGVTEADIAMLHDMDDVEVNAERREDYHTPCRFESFHAGAEKDDSKNLWLADESENPEASLIAAEDAVEYELRLQKLTAAIESLLPAQRDLFIKVYVQKRKITDIAAEEGVSRAAIHRRLNKMHEKLKKLF